MKKLFITFLLCFSAVSSAQINTAEQIITPGVIHKKIINLTDTLSIDILKIDMSSNDYIIRSVKANNLLGARETTSGMTKILSDSGYNVIAALNADFFETDGEVVNNMISEGKFVKAVKFTDSPYNEFVNSQLAVTYDNKLFIEQFVFTGNLILPDGSIEEIRRINSKSDSNSITLYNSFQGEQTPIAQNDWVITETMVIPMDKNTDTLFCLIGNDFQRGGNVQIPDSGFILSANNKYAHYFERELSSGDTVKLLLTLNPHFPGIRSLTGGWPQIVKDGMNVIKMNPATEGVIPRFSESRHPRTGIGFSEDSLTIYLITVDGRQEISRGMSLLEFAALMIDEGIYHGLNLDGGGSTAMIINDKVVNSPSDESGERAVGNCLVLIKKE
ncbi:MAG: phosphodiester glycosidase family protein [Ignavibacteriaceae bacterium]